uniref:LITAF domain-containing protein n=2 Tax=Cyclopterus lumpus TaxID=8103 RepID=A0A8C2XE92_CYCLU
MKNEVSIASCQIEPDVPVPCVDIVYIGGPPNITAPAVILDTEHFPPYPCRTQCPECKQFIMTEIFTSVSSVTWLVCFTTAVIGCVAGCCFIPFCMKQFKSITHRCPECQTNIMTLKKL